MAGLSGMGALAEGFARGLRLSSDMQDAEQRRGLNAMQAEQTKLNLDRDKEMAGLSKQLGQEFIDYRDGTGAYAPAEGQTYDRTSESAADLHYNRIQPLLQKQAALSGKNPAIVDKEIKELRREGYAEKVFRAAQLMEAGDVDGGVKILKPLYKKMFADGTDVKNVAYDKSKDALTLTTVSDGRESVVEMPRGKVVDMLNYGALQPGDAVKLGAQRKEKEADRAHESTLTDKKISGQKEVANIEARSRAEAANIHGQWGVKAHEAGAKISNDHFDQKVYEANRDQFVASLPAAFDYDPKNQFKDKNASSLFNSKSSEALSIWDATSKSGVNLSGAQVATVMDALGRKEAKVLQSKDGYAVVQVGAIKAVVPMK